MRSRLRVLERALVCQRGQVIVGHIAEDFVEEWAEALDNDARLPDPIDLAQQVVKHGVPVLTVTPLTSYLTQCQRDNHIPDPERITQAIVHGFLEMRFKQRCACGYHT